MRTIVAMGVGNRGLVEKRDFIVYNHVSTSVLANSSLYAILSQEMEAFDWL